MEHNKLNFIDIFCGAGGFSAGLELAGHKCLLGIDNNKHAIQTFVANHQFAESFCGDIVKLNNQNILKLLDNKKIDLIVGGPPCQGFSTVGKGNPDDIRNTLFLEYFRIVKLLMPKIIIIENVTGLIAKKNENVLRSIFKKFQEIGYQLDCKVLSADHYKVPSKRRRTIIIGNRINVKNIYPSQSNSVITAGEALRNINSKVKNHDLNLSEIKNKLDLARLKCIPQGKGIRYQVDEEKYLPTELYFNIDWAKLSENRFRQTKYQRINKKLVAPTILTQRRCYYHPTQHRYLTSREAARLQSFRDDFIFKGPLTQQWRQIGNAVPPMLAYHLGQTISQMINAQNDNLLINQNNNDTDLHLKKYVSQIRENAFNY